MVYVPGGEFTMGRDDGDEYERPAHRETVKELRLDELLSRVRRFAAERCNHGMS